MKASELFVKSLENEDVKHVFGLPGEENLDVMDAFLNLKATPLLQHNHCIKDFLLVRRSPLNLLILLI